MAVVSGFHVVEPIPFDALRMLVNEAHRVLIPGGLLILETPNPENLLVGTSSFYQYPTHRWPVPAQLLYFLVEYYDCARNKILRLQESPSLSYSENLKIRDISVRIGPGYAIVAQKSPPKKYLSLFDDAFNKKYGLAMDDLAMRYKIKSQEQLVREWNTAKSSIEDLNDQINHWRALVDSSNRELQSAYASRPWRITGPLCPAFALYVRLNQSLLSALQIIKGRIKGFFGFMMVCFVSFVVDHATLKSWAMAFERKIPALDAWVCQFVPSGGSCMKCDMPSSGPSQLLDLSPLARLINADLMAAMKKDRRS